MIVANGTGGQVPPADSIQVQNNGQFEGAIFGTGKVEFGNNSSRTARSWAARSSSRTT